MRDVFGGGARERRLKWVKVSANRFELGSGWRFRIRGGRRGAVLREAASEDGGGGLGRECAATQKYVGVAARDFAAGREFHDGDAREHHVAKGAFSAGAQHAMTIAHGDETGGAMRILELCDPKKNRELTGAVARGVAEIPLGAPDHGDSR